MKISLPLYGRIASWFILNLLIVGCLVFFFTRSLFPAEGQLSADESQRIETLAYLIGSKLQGLDESLWQDELLRLQKSNGFEFQTFTLAGRPPRSLTFKTPKDVFEQLEKYTLKAKIAPRRTGPRGNLRPKVNQELESEIKDNNTGELPRRRNTQRLRAQSSEELKAQSLLSYVDTEDKHWFLAQVSLGQPSRKSIKRPHAILLLMKASEETANGLGFDPKPWWALGFGILFIGIIMWAPFTWQVTRYISQLTKTTETIASGDFKVRNSSSRNDELGRLGSAIDKMAHRLDGFVNGQRRFMSDIAHELCGPLVRMQLTLGVIELNPEKTKEKLAGLRLEIDEMNKMVEELLDFSRASLTPEMVALEAIDLYELVQSAFARECPPHQTNSIPAGTYALGNRHLLIRAIGNIARNSIRYAGTEAHVKASIEQSQDHAILHIDDNGPGIPEQHITKIFDPFYRIDEARSREDGGTGLGLAIVDTCAKACQGEVTSSNLSPNGLRISIKLKKPS